MRPLAVCVLLAGCDGVFGLGHLYLPGDGSGDGSPHDAAPGCYGTGLFVEPFCLGTAMPRAGTSIPTSPDTMDTATDSTCTIVRQQVGGPELCVIFVDHLTVPPGVQYRAVGARPLVIVATGSIDFSGIFDGSSYRIGGGTGPSANVQCTGSGSGTSGSGTFAGGGGAGGSFVSAGGNGGNGGVIGGVPATAFTPSVIRGGCPGGDGGGGTLMGPVGAAGGGSLYLVAGRSITIAGRISASGAGGAGGDLSAGGAGGGAGGMVAFDAPTVTMKAGAAIYAVGGGGGQGGANTGAGSPGVDGGSGGSGATGGGKGGAGSASAGEAGSPGGGTGAAGGGGGGGGGFVAIYALSTPTIEQGTIITPPPMLP